jgi:hypothetical protein
MYLMCWFHMHLITPAKPVIHTFSPPPALQFAKPRYSLLPTSLISSPVSPRAISHPTTYPSHLLSDRVSLYLGSSYGTQLSPMIPPTDPVMHDI